MFSTGFSMETERIAEPVDGPSTQFLARAGAAPRRVGVRVDPGAAPERARPVNRLVLAGPDGELHHYDKIHPFTYGGEHEHYDAGDAFLTVEIEGLRVSFFVCYDLRFADEFWARAHGDRLLRRRRELARVAPRPLAGAAAARAIENQAYVVGVNRVGNGRRPRLRRRLHDHRSARRDVVRAGAHRDGHQRDVERAEVEKVRAEFPFLQDRR